MKQLTTQILRRRFKRLVFLFLMGLFLSQPLACKKKENKYAPPPPPKVTVMLPEIQDVTVYLYMTGRTAAINKVDIVARVRGYLEKIYFKDGEIVKKGQLLFTIDPREYIATLHKSEADLLNAKSSLNFAKNDLDRREKAYRKKAVSELDYLRAKAEYDKAKAAVAAAEANVEEAKLNLSYTRIHAPITGKTSRHLIDAGNLVGASGPTVLTTVVSLNPIYAYFNINERDVARYLRKVAKEGRKEGKVRPKRIVPVNLALATEKGYLHEGKLDYVDNRVDPNTGTLQARAVFPNDDRTIVPGFFAKIRIPDRVERKALLAPERAIGLDQVGRYLYVVGQDNKVRRRDIKTGPLVGTMRVIEKGLKKDERVIVEGILRVRPGVKVQPVVFEKKEITEKPAIDKTQEKPGKSENTPKANRGKDKKPDQPNKSNNSSEG